MWTSNHFALSAFVAVVTVVVVWIHHYVYTMKLRSSGYPVPHLTQSDYLRSIILGFGFTYAVLYYFAPNDYAAAMSNVIKTEPDF